MNRSPLRALLLLAGLALGGLLLGACGDSDDDAAAQAALVESVSATSDIESGRLTANLELEPEGRIALGGPITFRAEGPFVAPAAGELPKARVALAGKLAGQSLRATATTTGKRAFLRVDGDDYELDRDTVSWLIEALGGSAGGGFASLGLDPSGWITGAQTEDDATVGGVDTTHISGEVDAARLLEDVAKLLDAAGAGGLLTDELRERIADGVKSTKVDVYSGAQDQILRRLVLAIEFAFEQGDSPITGLEGGTINLDLRVDDVNDTDVEVTVPKQARPLSELRGGGLGALLDGLGAALPGGGGASGEDSPAGDDGEAFLECVREAAGDEQEVADCAEELTP
ncbi:MAG: hypothetical protein ACR2LK_10375 [Solirubrobacteraceae bacterium]